MKRLWLRWIGLALFVVILAGVMVRLGEWQLHRLSGRREANAIVRAHEGQPVVDWAQVFTPGKVIGADDQWTRVTVTGSYDAAHQLQIRYRKSGDQQGSEVITPLRAADGRTVLVDRGFIPRAGDGTDPDIADIPAPPGGTVTVIGYVRGNENGKDSAVVPVDGRARLINSQAIGRAQGGDYVDGYIMLASSMPPQSARITPLPLPQLDEGPHLSYAIQWFCFTAIAVGGLFVLIRGDIRDRRTRRERSARRAHRPAPVGKPATRNGVPIDSATGVPGTGSSSTGPSSDDPS
ncbi:SURF1 family protein [Acidipropionibacterium jensenii]|uniref:SURF1-like protein n=1 Tax=Acidipropionibacterium jensenii TaxID=1749 RepID=A0A3T0RYF6_9ACTN|nr:SURF1 family protein [Acidipropionibacterium jensenii]AZZ39135.1 SURF1 family protein [Acidipropionibacterium jensenii]